MDELACSQASPRRCDVSRSPRKSLQQAAHALGQFVDVLDAHPDARREVAGRIGEDGLTEIEAIRRRVAALADRLEAPLE
jgi:hypothetical protein